MYTYQCKTGHSFCDKCVIIHQLYATCKKPTTFNRNYTLQALLQEISPVYSKRKNDVILSANTTASKKKRFWNICKSFIKKKLYFAQFKSFHLKTNVKNQLQPVDCRTLV